MTVGRGLVAASLCVLLSACGLMPSHEDKPSTDVPPPAAEAAASAPGAEATYHLTVEAPRELRTLLAAKHAPVAEPE